MLVFLDESGDAGLKLGTGSSDFFVVTLVIFDDLEQANKADKLVDVIRKNLRLNPLAEFKFNKLRNSGRVYFLETISQVRFKYYSIVLNKAKLQGPGFSFKESLYKFACKLAFENAQDQLNGSTIIIDGSGSREFKSQLQSYIKRNLNDNRSDKICVKKVKIQDSKKNNLLQLADMICGAIARSYNKDANNQSYRNIIRKKEARVQLWPK